MSSSVGTRITLEQARALGAIQSYEPHGTDSGDGIWENTSGNGVFNATDNGAELSVSAETGAAWSSIATISATFASGRLVVFNAWEVNQAIGNLANEYEIGVLWRGSGSALSPEDEVVFNPGAGQDTDGNVRVLSGTTETTGQVTYPTINDGAIFTNLLIDNERGQTEFYVQKNPLTAQPDEVIAAVPEFVRSFGGLNSWNTGESGDANETLTMTLSGYIYIP